ncbi:diguanylate cyclase, partial [Yoonia sp.]|uniref:diguanylate cyclase n=1 Tax=Yoonia sp. TaxID=2212373 RepID=UPI0025E1D3CA
MKTDPEQTAAFAAVHEISRRDLLGHVFEESAAEIYAFDAGNLRFVAVNMAGRAALGKGMRQLTQLRADDLLTGMSSARLAMLLHNIARRRSACARLRTRKLRPTSEGVICDIKVRYLAGPVPTYLASVHDVPDPAAACVNGSLRAAIDALADGFVLYDKDDRLVLCNDRYRQIYASSAPIITLGARFEDILRDGLKHNQYADAIGREDVWLASRLQAHAVSDHMIEQEQTSGQWLRIEERKTRDGGRVGMRMDITQLKRDQAALERVARTDELTGLLNRRGLLEQMRNLVGDLARDQRIAVLHVDLDKFKSINDAHGHDAGDFVLRHCARLLKKGIAENHHVARFGGDEFIVAISTSQSDACVVALAQGLIAGLSLPVSFCNRICSFGASIGVAFYTPHLPDTLENVLTGADIALNAAKRAGRGECHVFEVRMRDAAVRSVEMAEDIRSGLYAGEFAPYFQPQIDTETDEIIGFEALIR